MSFHIVPNVFGLKWNERLVLDALCYYANNETHKCYPSQETIAKWCDIDRKKVIDAIKGLKEKGIIKTKKTKTTLIYTIIIELTGSISTAENGITNETKKVCCSENGTACCTENGTETILNELYSNISEHKSSKDALYSGEQTFPSTEKKSSKTSKCKNTLTLQIYNKFKEFILGGTDCGAELAINFARLGKAVKQLKTKGYSDDVILLAFQDALHDNFFKKTKSIYVALSYAVINKYLIKHIEAEKQLKAITVKKQEIKDIDDIDDKTAWDIFNKAVRKSKIKAQAEQIEKEVENE